MWSLRTITQGKPLGAYIMSQELLQLWITVRGKLIRLVGDYGKFSNTGINDARAQFSIYERKRIYCKLGTFPEDMYLFVRIEDFVRVKQPMNALLLK
jgi:hypothetical protein